MRLSLLATLLSLCFAAASARAESAPLATPDLSEFPSAKAQIEKDLKEGKRYSELTRRQREDVIAALERIEQALSGVKAVSELDPADRAELMNDQELVNTLLTKAEEDSRLICTHERKTGSHRPTTRCRTVAQTRQEQEAAKEFGRRLQKSHQRSPSEPRGG